MKTKKTTAQRLKYTKTYEAQEILLLEWKDNWYKDQKKTIEMLKNAVRRNDYGTVMHSIDVLQGMTEKRFGTLENMIHIMNHRDWDLIHRTDVSKETIVDSCGTDTVESDKADIRDSAKTDIINLDKSDIVDSVNKDINKDVKELAIERNKIPSSKKTLPEEVCVAEIARLYSGGMSVKNLADDYGMSEEKITKLLVTYGVYTSDLYDKIKGMRELGKSDQEIRDLLVISKKAFHRYVPYIKGVYGLENVSDGATRVREWRARKRVDK